MKKTALLFVLFTNIVIAKAQYIPPATSVVDRQFNFHVVDKNVWRCSQPSPEAIIELKSNYGLKTILNLRGINEAEDSEAQLADSLGLNYISFPMDARYPQNQDSLQMVLKIVNDSTNYPILIHCLGGKDRTGLVVALYKLEKYHTPKPDLITEILMYGQDSTSYPLIIKELKEYKEK